MLIPVKCLEPILATIFVKAQKSFGCQYYRLIVNVQYVIPILGKPIHKCYHVNDIRLLARKQVKLVISDIPLVMEGEKQLGKRNREQIIALAGGRKEIQNMKAKRRQINNLSNILKGN